MAAGHFGGNLLPYSDQFRVYVSCTGMFPRTGRKEGPDVYGGGCFRGSRMPRDYDEVLKQLVGNPRMALYERGSKLSVLLSYDRRNGMARDRG